MAPSFLPKNAFLLPTPIAPKLVALGLDSKTAASLSKVYISAAFNLKEVCEAEYICACNAIVFTSEDRGHSSKELRSKLLTVAVARYMQVLSKWGEEATSRAKASLLQRDRKVVPEPEMKNITILLPEPSRRGSPRLCSTEENVNAVVKLVPFCNKSPPHAFPQPYPPPARPEPVSFVTHIPLFERGSRWEPRAASDNDLDACIDAFSRLSFDPSPQSKSSLKPLKSMPESRSRTRTTSTPKLTSRLSPSHPRLVSPTLDTSVAVSQKSLPKRTPSYPSPTTIPRTQNIDIPRSNRRKACSISHRRPTIHPSTSSESPLSPSFSRSIRRTPSLVSDHGSEASSPSTSPDFSSIPTPTSTLARKGSFPEVIYSLEHSPIRHSEWHRIDFGAEIYS